MARIPRPFRMTLKDCVASNLGLSQHGERRFGEAFLYAFDLIEVDGEDLRHQPFTDRKARLAKLLGRQPGGIAINEHVEADGATVFAAARRMGLEGIVSKRLDAPYRSGRSRDWIKAKKQFPSSADLLPCSPA
jgi:ATP-dependent DNA ligase